MTSDRAFEARPIAPVACSALLFAFDPHTQGHNTPPHHARHRRGNALAPFSAQRSQSHRGQDSGPDPWQRRWPQLGGVAILIAAIIVLLWPGSPLALGLGALIAAGIILLALASVALMLLIARRPRP
jgi:hypothetical protein